MAWLRLLLLMVGAGAGCFRCAGGRHGAGGTAGRGEAGLHQVHYPRASHGRDVAPGKDGAYKWFSGQWYAKPPSLDHYSTEDGVLVLKQGGDLVSTPRDFSAGKLPLLPGADGFYVEFEVRLSGQDGDYFPAVWLMPAEHSGKQQDQYRDLFPSDPPGYERWMEFDIDEGGFGPGLTGTVHTWWGSGARTAATAPAEPQQRLEGAPRPQQEARLRRQLRPGQAPGDLVGGRRGADGTAAPYVSEVAPRQHYYLIISAQSHGKDKPYLMYISGVRAFAPPKSAVPAVP